jgi:hypothetical protein
MKKIAQKIKSEIGIKTIDIGNGEFLHFWYANNRGRGTNNVTIIRSSAPRAETSRQQTDVIATEATSGWAGRVNFSRAVARGLGL